MWRSCDICPLAQKNPFFVLKGIGGTTGQSCVTRQLWLVTCYMTQKGDILVSLRWMSWSIAGIKSTKGKRSCKGVSRLLQSWILTARVHRIHDSPYESWNATSWWQALLMLTQFHGKIHPFSKGPCPRVLDIMNQSGIFLNRFWFRMQAWRKHSVKVSPSTQKLIKIQFVGQP